MRIDAIPVGKNPPDEINVIIEVPVGGEPIKYELDKDAGAMFVDRFLYTPMRYPGNYGFIPHTLSDDGDPVDVLVANTRPILPGAVLACRPIGVLIMQYETMRNYTDLPSITVQQIEHFFAHYKDLEGEKWSKIEEWGDAAVAKRMILDAMARAKAEG
jgi:inorganic pyrophosphatase